MQADVADMEQRLEGGDAPLGPGMIPARRPVVYRAYEVSDPFFDTPRSPAEIREHYNDMNVRVVFVRARINGVITDPSPEVRITLGSHIVLGGRSEEMAALPSPPGKEVADHELLNFGAERTPVTIASKDVDGMTHGPYTPVSATDRASSRPHPSMRLSPVCVRLRN